MKKVLLVIIDAFNSRVTRPALEQGRLPHMQRLIEEGQVCWDTVSIFPSITPAATSSICTGKYPAEHSVLGAHYYDRVADEVHYFGSDLSVVIKRGFRDFFEDFLLALNQRYLDATTLFEALELEGHRCASLNFLVFHGRCRHSAQTPWLLRLIPTLPSETELLGPEILCLGDFVAEEHQHEDEPLEGESGLFARFGFNDNATGKYLLELAERGLPDFTIAYFPDNDFNSHEKDPYTGVETVENVDQWLGKLAEQYGGVDRMLEELTIVISGDHAQSDVLHDAQEAGIDLIETLSDFDLVPAGQPWKSEDQVMACANLRASQIYLRQAAQPRREELVQCLLEEPKIDQVIWSELQGEDRPTRYVVATAERGRLTFQIAPESEATYADAFGNHWQVEGDWQALDATPTDQRRIEYGVYPNALERIAMSFDPRYAGDLWATAKPGHEFSLPLTTVHVGGGSHGSLHEHDSLSPLIFTGSKAELELPAQMRTIDMAPLCMRLLNEQPQREVGAGVVPKVSG